MPMYEYACRDCGTRFERLKKFEERLNAETCPQCKAAHAALVLSVPGFVGAAAGGGSGPASCGGDMSFGGGCCGGGACGVN